jgi:hypothetical protein
VVTVPSEASHGLDVPPPINVKHISEGMWCIPKLGILDKYHTSFRTCIQ